MREPLIQCLVRFPFSRCDIEPCPIRILHLVANSPITLNNQTVLPILPLMDKGLTSPYIGLPLTTTIQHFCSFCSCPETPTAMCLASRWECMNSGSDCHLKYYIWEFWLAFFWVSSTGSSLIPSHGPTTELSQASSLSICGCCHYVPDDNDIFT